MSKGRRATPAERLALRSPVESLAVACGGRQGPLLIVAGTRPEVIKLAPVYFAARASFGEGRVRWISTGQHQELEAQTLAHFGIECAERLVASASGGSLLELNACISNRFSRLLQAETPALVIVQGDTASAYAGALAAFHNGVPVAHVEAGLRTYDTLDPYPEEAYRRMISVLATLHFAPTPRAAANLIAEGCERSRVQITGNTVVDALALIDAIAARQPNRDRLLKLAAGRRLVLVTMHRRESWGGPLREMCLAIRDLADRFDDVQIIYPVHVNPRVQEQVRPLLADHPRIRLLPPLDYVDCHTLICRADLILTDSGGIQEEAPSYGVPVLVMRRRTERPEAVEEGMAVLVGTERRRIVEVGASLLLAVARAGARRGRSNPYGDGRAAERIITALQRYLRGENSLLSQAEEFGAASEQAAVA